MIGVSSALQMGCALGLATILSVGPTNLTVLREGLMRGRTGLVVFLFTATATAFMASAYLAADVLGQLDPTVQSVLSWVAVAVLVYFAFKAFRAATRYKPPTVDARNTEAVLTCARRVLPIVLLNPLAYLEFFFVPAAIFQNLDTPHGPFEFVAGVIVVSYIGFCVYGFGGRMIGAFFSRAGTLRVFDRVCGVILAGVAAVLTLDLMT